MLFCCLKILDQSVNTFNHKIHYVEVFILSAIDTWISSILDTPIMYICMWCDTYTQLQSVHGSYYFFNHLTIARGHNHSITYNDRKQTFKISRCVVKHVFLILKRMLHLYVFHTHNLTIYMISTYFNLSCQFRSY